MLWSLCVWLGEHGYCRDEAGGSLHLLFVLVVVDINTAGRHSDVKHKPWEVAPLLRMPGRAEHNQSVSWS